MAAGTASFQNIRFQRFILSQQSKFPTTANLINVCDLANWERDPDCTLHPKSP